VFGGRDYADWRHVWRVLDELAAEHGALTVVEGGGSGAAAHARAWVLARKAPHAGRSYAAKPGPGLPAWAALKKRSREMVDDGGDVAVVFDGNDGTRDEVKWAKIAGIPLRDERTGRAELTGG